MLVSTLSRPPFVVTKLTLLCVEAYLRLFSILYLKLFVYPRASVGQQLFAVYRCAYLGSSKIVNLKFDTPRQESANVSIKGPNDNHFRLGGPRVVSVTYSSFF